MDEEEGDDGDAEGGVGVVEELWGVLVGVFWRGKRKRGEGSGRCGK